MDRSHIFTYDLPRHRITSDLSEQVGDDNPLAVEVAKPLFDAGINFAAITERPEFLCNDFWARSWHTFILIIQGQMHVSTIGETFALSAGDLAFCPAGVPYLRTGLPGQPLQWIYIWIDDIPAWEPLKQLGPYTRPYESADLLFLLLRRVLDAHRFRGAEMMPLAHYCSHAIVDLLRQEIMLAGRPLHPYSVPMHLLMSDIQQNPGTNWTPAAMAKRLNVSERKLYRIFNSEYGMSPKEMVIKQRIARASEELAGTTTPICAISEALGYQSLYSFSNLFMKHTGMRPSAYRNRFR